jgi:hypothetical protein
MAINAIHQKQKKKLLAKGIKLQKIENVILHKCILRRSEIIIEARETEFFDTQVLFFSCVNEKIHKKEEDKDSTSLEINKRVIETVAYLRFHRI